jgi:hypothetical protein
MTLPSRTGPRASQGAGIAGAIPLLRHLGAATACDDPAVIDVADALSRPGVQA